MRTSAFILVSLVLHTLFILAWNVGEGGHANSASHFQDNLIKVYLHSEQQTQANLQEKEATLSAVPSAVQQVFPVETPVAQESATFSQKNSSLARYEHPQPISVNNEESPIGKDETIAIPEVKAPSRTILNNEEGAIYLRPQDITERPRLLQDIPSSIRLTTVNSPVESIILKLLIDEFGNVNKVEIQQSDLPSEVEKTIVSIFSVPKFIPGKLNGMPVKTWFKIEVKLESVNQISVIRSQ